MIFFSYKCEIQFKHKSLQILNCFSDSQIFFDEKYNKIQIRQIIPNITSFILKYQIILIKSLL